jgi:carbamoyltransferase
MKVVGLNYFSHDVSATLLEKGKILMAIEEERLSRLKHHAGFWLSGGPPIKALKTIEKKFGQPDVYVHGWNLTDKICEDIRNVSDLITSQYNQIPQKILSKRINDARMKFRAMKNFERKLTLNGSKLFRVNHHKAHAAAIFRTSGFNKSAILIIDANGEREGVSFWTTNRGEIEKIKDFSIYQSIGKLYTRVSDLLGMGIGGEGKTMALADYIRPPKFSFVRTKNDSFEIKWNLLKNVPLRIKNEPINKIHKKIAAALQRDLELVSLKLATELKQLSGYKKISFGGGVALNCKLNSIIWKSNLFSDMYLSPVPNDSGTSLGAALEYSFENGLKKTDKILEPFFGPSFSDAFIAKNLEIFKNKIEWERIDYIEKVAAELIAKNYIIGFFQGRMEYGPRALGNRSILANPSSIEIKDKVNEIKNREKWRPLAPAILEKQSKKYFEKLLPSYMMAMTFNSLPERRNEIKGALHIDKTARIQMVNKNLHPHLFKLLQHFRDITGLPLVINTSFNLKNEPIVMTPNDAIMAFLRSDLDFLILEDFLILKK